MDGQRAFKAIILPLWLLSVSNTIAITYVVYQYTHTALIFSVLIGLSPLIPVGAFSFFMNKHFCRERLKENYYNHESKRHFQVLQSLLYIEKYDEAKSYIEQVNQHN